jgi:benzoate/toluate 1,2-dioxygenase beta subunit
MSALNEPYKITRAEAESFILRECRLLDDKRFSEWMDLFTDDGYYWVPASLGQPDPHEHVSLMFDDKEIMTQRITRLTHPRAYAQLPPSRAVRQVSNISLETSKGDAAECTTRSVFVMAEYRPTLPEPMQRVFAGTFWHRLRREGTELKIASKKVELINCDATFSPVFLYF